MNVDDLQGHTYGLLTVCGAGQRPAGNRSMHTYLNCVCVCGRIVKVSRSNLVTGQVKSCGVCIRPNYNAPRTGTAKSSDPLKFSQSTVNR